MKRSMFRLLTISLSIIVIGLFAGSVFAQGKGGGNGGGGNGGGGGGGEDPPASPFNYRIEYASLPSGVSPYGVSEIAEVTDGLGISGMVAVGSYFLNDWPRHGFVYDHLTGEFTDVHDLFGLDNYWSSTCDAINSFGIVVGAVNDGLNRRAFWFDLFAAEPTLNFVDDTFPSLGVFRLRPRDINDHGDILIGDLDGSGFVANTSTGELIPLPSEMQVDNKGLNNSRVVIARRASLDGGTIRFDAVTGESTTFVDLNYYGDVNANGEVCATFDIYQRRNKFKTYACTHDGIQIIWNSDPIQTGLGGAQSINDEGDVVFQDDNYRGWIYHSTLDQSYDLQTLVSDSFFLDSEVGALFVTNRDQNLVDPTSTISGTANGSNGERRIFFFDS